MLPCSRGILIFFAARKWLGTTARKWLGTVESYIEISLRSYLGRTCLCTVDVEGPAITTDAFRKPRCSVTTVPPTIHRRCKIVAFFYLLHTLGVSLEWTHLTAHSEEFRWPKDRTLESRLST